MHRIITLFLLITILGCSKDATVGISNYPYLTTLPVTEISKNGAVMTAEFTDLGSFEIEEFGFIWYLDNSSEERRTVKDQVASLGSYSLNVSTTLFKGGEYKVKAFATSDGKTTYGNEVSFVSLGSKAPIISLIKPINVSYCDTIEIHGKNFSTANLNQIRFSGLDYNDNSGEKVIFKSDSLLKVLYPRTGTVQKSLISVSILSNIAYAPNSITFLAPVINGLSKETSVPGDTLIIHGENFIGHYHIITSNESPDIELVSVLFNNKKGEILNIDCNQIEVVVPSVSNPVNIDVKMNSGVSSSTKDLKMLEPEIIQISPEEGFWGDEVEISGQNFGHLEEGVQVLFNNAPAEIVDFSNDKIVVKVPYGSSNPLKVKVLVSNQASNKVDFLFLEMEINSITPNQGTWGDLITLSGSNLTSNSLNSIVKVDDFEAEIISQYQNAISFYIPKEVNSKNAQIQVIRNDEREKDTPSPFIMNDPQISSLSSVSIDLSETLTIEGINFHTEAERNVVTFKNTRLDVDAASSNSLDVKFPLSLISNQLISESLEGAITLSTDIGIATSEVIQVDYSGPWTELKKPNLLGDNHNGMVTTISEEGIYLFGGQKNQGGLTSYSNKVQLYNINSNEWSDIADLPSEGRTNANFFKNGNSIFIGSGQSSVNQFDFWKFDLTSNSWIQLQNVPYSSFQDGSPLISNGNVFSIINGGLKGNDKISKYVISEDSWSTISLEFPYQYYQLLGLFQSSDNFRMRVVEVNNNNISASTLHSVEFDAQLSNYTVIDSYSPIGVSQYGYIKEDQNISVLVSTNKNISLIKGRDISLITLPLNQITIEFIEIIAGVIYAGFSDGSFWSFDPSK